jgi:hypothetical protein
LVSTIAQHPPRQLAYWTEAPEATHARLLAQFDRERKRERVLCGSVTAAGLAQLARGSAGERLVKRAQTLQLAFAYSILQPTELALRLLPPYVRRHIYSYAYTRRASCEHPALPIRAKCEALKIVVMVSHDVPPVRPWEPYTVHDQWVLSVPPDATMNDVELLIRTELWAVEIEQFQIHTRGGMTCFGHLGQVGGRERLDWLDSVYISGALHFESFKNKFERVGQTPLLRVFVR